jgi:hypothetical protein
MNSKPTAKIVAMPSLAHFNLLIFAKVYFPTMLLNSKALHFSTSIQRFTSTFSFKSLANSINLSSFNKYLTKPCY